MDSHSFQQNFVSLRRLAFAAVASILLLCLVLANRTWTPPACLREAAAAAEGEGGVAQVAAVIGSANHKTGTMQLVCLGKAVQAAVDTNIISNTTASDTAAVAAAGRATPGRPSFLVTYFRSSHECYGLSPSKQAFKCPRPGFPCAGDGSAALSLDGCYFSFPTVPVGVLHFVRDPWDVVTSAYWFHQQEPAPEAWIDVEFRRRALAMVAEGVPRVALEALGLDLGASQSYGELLRTLPEEVGIQLEFWRSVPDLYAMARQYQFFRLHPGGLQLRYEDLQSRWSAWVARIGARFYPRHVAALVDKAKACDVGNWSKDKLAKSNHVTAGKHSDDDRLRLQRALAQRREVRRHLCAVCAVLEYDCALWCGGKQRR
ncbi:expressed protein [Chlorella variabilis]|uniref:Expressed protein n=1 Tax=Chlorella variabilis TaxID=554065 RepID=E1Z7G1_CHLVA|nr:expressed protein [Chlorella variabilis]EFN58165.1 expressed protein [Chlorella variabilis]|eukprot:XP_005850267.1 expressed protein [Chlorella variabilis]